MDVADQYFFAQIHYRNQDGLCANVFTAISQNSQAYHLWISLNKVVGISMTLIGRSVTLIGRSVIGWFVIRRPIIRRFVIIRESGRKSDVRGVLLGGSRRDGIRAKVPEIHCSVRCATCVSEVIAAGYLVTTPAVSEISDGLRDRS